MTNLENKLEITRRWRKTHKKEIIISKKLYLKNHLWLTPLSQAKQRCINSIPNFANTPYSYFTKSNN